MRVVAISVRSHERERRPARHHDDNKQSIPGWAAEREPKTEPPIANKNMSLGNWLTRVSANSGPKIAPGCGTKKSS
jgi:hypothetical protein